MGIQALLDKASAATPGTTTPESTLNRPLIQKAYDFAKKAAGVAHENFSAAGT